MENKLFHIYRNTPFGRETLLHSLYFCRQLELTLHLYIPETKQFLMYFDNNAVNVELDSSYLKNGDTARSNAEGLVVSSGVPVVFFEPNRFTASNLPDIPTDFDFMTCPRVISDLSTKIGLGKIGSKVRDILYNARFPVLISGQVFKKWESVAVMFGGSANGLKALHLGIKIAELTDMPLDMLTQTEKPHTRTDYEDILSQSNLARDLQKNLRHWHFFENGDFSANLFSLPHNALIIMGIFGNKKIKKLLFGTTTEMVQSILPNNLLLVGPEFEKHYWSHL